MLSDKCAKSEENAEPMQKSGIEILRSMKFRHRLALLRAKRSISSTGRIFLSVG